MTTMPLFVEELIPWMKDETYDGIVKVGVNHTGGRNEELPIVKYVNKRNGTVSYMMLYPHQLAIFDSMYCIYREVHAIVNYLKRKFKKYSVDSDQFIRTMFVSEMSGKFEYFDETDMSVIELWTYHDEDTVFMKNYQDFPLNSLQDLTTLFQHIHSDLHELYKNELLDLARMSGINPNHTILYHKIVISYFTYPFNSETFQLNDYSKYISMIYDWFHYASVPKQRIRNIPTHFSSGRKGMLIPVRTETQIIFMTSEEYRAYRDQKFFEYCRQKAEEWEELEKELLEKEFEDDED